MPLTQCLTLERALPVVGWSSHGFTSPQTFPNSLSSSHNQLPLILPMCPEVLLLRWTQDVDFQWTWCLRGGMWRSLSCGFLLQALLEPCRLVKLHVKCLAQGRGQRKQSSSAPGHICLPRSPSFLIPQALPLPASTPGPLHQRSTWQPNVAFQNRIR